MLIRDNRNRIVNKNGHKLELKTFRENFMSDKTIISAGYDIGSLKISNEAI